MSTGTSNEHLLCLHDVVFKGAVTVGDETTPNEKYHTLVLDSGKDGETGVSITSAEDGTEFVIVRILSLFLFLQVLIALCQVAGEPLDQPVVQYGPFVMTSREEIQKTFLDCKHRSPYRRSNPPYRCLELRLTSPQTKWASTASRVRGSGSRRSVDVELGLS